MEKNSQSMPSNESDVISPEPISYVFPIAAVEAEVEIGSLTFHQSVVGENEVHVKIVSRDQCTTLARKVYIVNPLHVHIRSELFLPEQSGNWKIEFRKHKNSEWRDKFYIHEKVQKKFRSIQDVAIFILYNRYLEDLKKRKHEIKCHLNSENIPSNEPDIVLSPEPISYVFPTSVVEPPEEWPDSSSAEHSMERKQRENSTSKVEKTYAVKFKLLQCKEVHETYILEMHEVEIGNVSIYQLTVHENEVQMKVLSRDQSIMLSPIVHIVNPLHVKPISKLFLRERLGKWTVEQKKYINSERRDKFYRHQKVPKKFRSLQEVATFILFNCYRDDLKKPKVETSQIQDMKEKDQ